MGTTGTTRIVSKQVAFACSWFAILKKSVRSSGSESEIEHYSVKQQDYVGVLAMTRDGLIPLVRQYRPAVESYTVEFPAGLIEPEEHPESAARRELTEETGLRASEIVEVCATFADTGRLSSRFFAYFALAEPSTTATVEPGMEVLFCSMAELRDRIRSNQFVLQTHLGILYAAAVNREVAAMLGRAGMPGLLQGQ